MKRVALLIITFLFVNITFGQNQTSETFEIKSKVFNNIRKVKVYLPQGYYDYPSRKYNVIYLFDAQSDELYNYVKATIDYPISSANIFISPVILVGIETYNRQFEFLPKNLTDQPLKDYYKQVKLGGADTLSICLRDEVMPAIQKKYHCTSFNIGIGHSLGATFLTFNLLKYPSIFNVVLAISPNYYYDNEQVLHLFDNTANSKLLDKKFLYIAYGKGDKLEERFKPATSKMDSLLIKKNIKGLTWEVQSLNNDSHATTPLEGIFKGIVAFNKELVPSDQEMEIFYADTKTSLTGNLRKFYKSRSDKFNIQLPTVEDLNHLAYNCFYSDKKNDAIEILKWALSLYPQDTNLYDSLGEIEQDSGNKKEALNSYSKGLEIVEQQKSAVSTDTYERLRKGFAERIKSTIN